MKNDWRFETGHMMTKIRVKHGLTQKELAEKTGLHQSSISRAESQGCSLEYLYRIAEKLGDEITIKLT